MGCTCNLTEMFLHSIVDVEIEQHQQNSGVCVIGIKAEDEDGHITEITMFSKDKIDITCDQEE